MSTKMAAFNISRFFFEYVVTFFYRMKQWKKMLSVSEPIERTKKYFLLPCIFSLCHSS